MDHGHRKAHAHVLVQADLDVMDAERVDLHASEKVDIGGAAVDLMKRKVDACLGHDLILRVEQTCSLVKLTDAPAPTRPETELEETDRQLWCRNRSDNSDQSLGATDFGADVLAEDH